MKVLLIESDPVLRAGYAYCLTAEGWRVVQMSHICQEEYMTAPFGAAVIDASVLTEQKKPLWLELARMSGRPIIALALSQEDEAQLRRCRLPHVAFLVKPFSLRRLTHLLGQMSVRQEVA